MPRNRTATLRAVTGNETKEKKGPTGKKRRLRHGPSGWRPSPFDGRDFRYAARFGAALAASIRLDHPFPSVNQGIVPCCVSCAVATCMEALDNVNPPATSLSRLFNYYEARPSKNKLEDLPLRYALDAAVRAGLPSAGLHGDAAGGQSFTTKAASVAPSAQAYANAQERRLVGWDVAVNVFRYYQLIGNVEREWRACLAAKQPIAIGFWITPAYWTLESGLSTHPPVEQQTSEFGHAAAVIGYDDTRGAFLVKDSRGKTFGVDGCWWLPYDLASTRLVHEAWALTKITYD